MRPQLRTARRLVATVLMGGCDSSARLDLDSSELAKSSLRLSAGGAKLWWSVGTAQAGKHLWPLAY